MLLGLVFFNKPHLPKVSLTTTGFMKPLKGLEV